MLGDPEALAAKRQKISERLHQAMISSLGKEWVETWHHGLPNAHESKYQTHLTGIVWAHNLIKAWGMLEFAKDRYGPMENHLKKWSVDKSKEENIKALGPSFGWMPGVAYSSSLDYSDDLANCPPENRERLLEAVQFVHQWASKPKEGEGEASKPEIPLDWEVAYDMRPWTAFPER